MASRVRVLCCVTVWGAVTTQSHVAGLTCAQMDPLTPNLYALIALALLWMFDRCNGFDMSTSLYRHPLILRYSIVLCLCGITVDPAILIRRIIAGKET
jgi:hypothetical protein